MKTYETYTKHLEDLSATALAGIIPIDSVKLSQALDGQPGASLREFVNRDERRAAGAFFTSSELRKKALMPLAPTIDGSSVIFDSSVGVGDLLVASAEHLPLGRDLGDTIHLWGHQLRGVDLDREFVRATKARLLLLAVQRCGAQAQTIIPTTGASFPYIRCGDGLKALADIAAASHLTLNPSYAAMEAPLDCSWSTGKVSTAAVFIAQSVTTASPGTEIVAILPDVLRTGTRYAKWRLLIEKHLCDSSIQVVGKFDTWTDIDVFILRGKINRKIDGKKICWWDAKELTSDKSVGDLYKVSVGPVVPHRDPHTGELYPYITSATITGQTAFDAGGADRRQYEGSTFLPPFVALRRTSRPGQRGRALGSVITGNERVAVENHLIVLKPNENSLTSCYNLLRILNDTRTAQWLDERIRCRHLTVSAVKELPWWPTTNRKK